MPFFNNKNLKMGRTNSNNCNKKKLSLLEEFNLYKYEFINKNPYWQGPLRPYYPIINNFKYLNKKYNLQKLQKDLLIAIKNSKNQWEDKSQKWHAITLRSFEGKNEHHLTKHELGEGLNNKYVYREEANDCNYFKEILNNFNTEIYLVRLLKLDSNSKVKYHSDGIVFQNGNDIIRCHIPILTNSKCIIKLGYPLRPPVDGFYNGVWNASDIYQTHLESGKLYFTNVNTLHSVENNGNTDRIHLVIDLKPTQNILEFIKK